MREEEERIEGKGKGKIGMEKGERKKVLRNKRIEREKERRGMKDRMKKVRYVQANG